MKKKLVVCSPKEKSAIKVEALQRASCADPESFIRGGPTVQQFWPLFFFLDKGWERIQLPLKVGQWQAHQRNAIEMALCWRADGA